MQLVSSFNMLGTDSEVIFLKNGKGFPATKVIPFTKKEPYVSGHTNYPEDRTRFRAHDDGRQGEFSTAADTCREYIQDSCWWALKYLDGLAKEKGVDMVLSPCERMTLKAIESGGPSCVESGCNPDIDGYSGEFNQASYVYAKVPYVMAGTHLHYSLSKAFMATEEYKNFLDVKMADRLVAIPLMALHPNAKAMLRRKYYGKAGCCRTKEYGREYRTLDASIMQAPWILSLAFGLLRLSIGIVQNGSKTDIDKIFSLASDDMVREIINRNVVGEAREYTLRLMAMLKPYVRGSGTILWNEYTLSSSIKDITKIIEKILLENIPLCSPDWRKNWRQEEKRVEHGNVNIGFFKWVNFSFSDGPNYTGGYEN